MRDTTRKGDLTELEVAMALMRAGRKVLRPMSTGLRYDLVVDDGRGRFLRVQCKTGILRDGAVQFRLYSINASHGFTRRTYDGEVDAFGVYCPQTRRCYLVPMDAILPNSACASLRVAAPRNGQASRVRHADSFVIGALGRDRAAGPTRRLSVAADRARHAARRRGG